MVTFKKAEGDLRLQAETYLGRSLADGVNVYAAVDDGLVGAGALRLDGGVVKIEAFEARPEFRAFTLRSLVFVAANTGLTVEGAQRDLTGLGFTEENGVYRCAAADVMFPCQCGKEEIQ